MTASVCVSVCQSVRQDIPGTQRTIFKAKFHYASWLEAGSKLVADRFEAKFHYAIWFEPASNQLRTRFEPAQNQKALYWNLVANLLARASSLLAS